MDETGIFSYEKMTSNSETYSLHFETAVEHDYLERKVSNSINKQHEAVVEVFTSSVAAKSLAISSSFKVRDQKKLQHRVYPFMAQWKLSCRMITKTGQKLNKDPLYVHEGFSEALNIKFKP